MINFDVAKARREQLGEARPFPYAIKLHLALDDSCMMLEEHEKAI